MDDDFEVIYSMESKNGEYSQFYAAKRAKWNLLMPNPTKLMKTIPLQLVSRQFGNLVPCRTSVMGTSGRRGQEDEQQKQSVHVAAPQSLT